MRREGDQLKKYVMISNDIRKKIIDGIYQANDQLPFERELCETYEVSKMTVKKALDILVTEGLIIKRRGSGTFVKDMGPEETKRVMMANQFRGTTAINPDIVVESEILEFAIIHPPETVAEKLNMNADYFVYDIYRVRIMNGEPTVIEKTYMPIDVIPSLKREHVASSIYEYIEDELALGIQSAHRIVTVRKATPFEAEKLGLEDGDPVAVAEQVGYLNTGTAFEYSISVHRYDHYSAQFVLTRN